MNYLQVPVEKNGIQVRPILESKYNILYITPSHQFPTGHVTNLKREPNLFNGHNKMNNVTLLKMIMIQSSGTLVNLYQLYKV